MNVLCHKPNPPPTKLHLCLRNKTQGPDADAAFNEMHKAMLHYSDKAAFCIIGNDDRHQHVELSGAYVEAQKAMILEALELMAHGHWEITEGGELLCQENTT